MLHLLLLQVFGLDCSSLGSLLRSHSPLREVMISSLPGEAPPLPVSAVVEVTGEREVAVYYSHGTAGAGLRLGGGRWEWGSVLGAWQHA